MLKTILPGRNLPPPQNKPVYEAPAPSRLEREQVEKAYARLFATDDGKLVLGHLQTIAFMRAYSAESSDEQIRYAEGQRALVAHIMRLVNAGRMI